MLLYGYLENPLSEALHEGYNRDKQRSEFDLSGEDVSGMRKAGYSEEQIEQFRQELFEVGETQEGDVDGGYS